MGEKRDAYVQKLKGKLDKWNVEIDVMAAKAERAKEDAKAQCLEKIAELKVTRKALEEKIEELQKAGETAWKDVKTGVDSARQALGKSLQSARSRFN